MYNCNNHNNCIDLAIKKTEDVFSKKNIAFTVLRRKILKFILENHAPFGAYDILDKLKLESKSAKPITVYRILDLFLANNIVHKIESQNKFLACSHPGENHHCWFLICDNCNIVQELCSESLKQMIDSESQKLSFVPKKTILEIKGVCKSCFNLSSE